MKKLKQIRVIISIVMLAECLALALLGIAAPSHARLAGGLQLTLEESGGHIAAVVTVWLLWMVATLLLGRVYCGAFCPLGVMQDVLGRVRTLLRLPAPPRRSTGHQMRWWILAGYGAAVITGAAVVPLILEPWPAFMNIAQQAAGDGPQPHSMAMMLGAGATWGIICGAASLLLVAAYALLRGRDFCNDVCPVGSILTLAASRAAMHMELHPDLCTYCMKCEQVCKAGCIDIKSRTVDDHLCTRCFNCVAVCPQRAIRYQLNADGIVTPMLRRSTSPTA